MNTYTSSTGTTYTDEDIERWGEEAERGILPGIPGPTYWGALGSRLRRLPGKKNKSHTHRGNILRSRSPRHSIRTITSSRTYRHV